jgi:arylsulfatase A-like enzyme
MDATATALAAAGAKADPAADGIDLSPLLTTSAAPSERTFYWRAGARAALRQGAWKIMRETSSNQARAWQLYNLAEDIGERTDLAAKEPARVADLAARWNQWSAAQAAPLW